MTDRSFARAWRTVAELQPDRTAVVCGDRRVSFAELDRRASQLGTVLRDAGVGPDDKVAIMCVNAPEYIEAFYAAQKLGAVPVNVNYRYVGAELAYLLDNSDAVALVYHDDFAATVADALATLPAERRPRLLLQVAHAGDRALLDGAVDYVTVVDAAPADPPTAREPSGDDLVFLYTGGTTGSPKAVMWRSDDLYVSLWQMARPGTEPPDVEAAMRADKRAATCLPACPLMHGTGLFIALSTLSGGGTVVLLDTQRLDADGVWDAVEREHVQAVTIVGDAFAASVAGGARRRAGTMGPVGPARDHIVGRHVEPGDEARLAEAPAARGAHRFAWRFRRNHDAHRDARRRGDRPRGSRPASAWSW